MTAFEGNGDCETIRDFRIFSSDDTDQPTFATIAKYVIMGLAGINIIREVSHWWIQGAQPARAPPT